jgi:hypothetical protein
MRTVIGEYESWSAATSAVRALESLISIQGIVIKDQRQPTRQQRDPLAGSAKASSKPEAAAFVVSMTGRREQVDEARAFLRKGREAATP